MFSVPVRTRMTACAKPDCICASTAMRLESSPYVTGMSAVRSHWAIRRAVSTATSRSPPSPRRTLRSTSTIAAVATMPSVPMMITQRIRFEMNAALTSSMYMPVTMSQSHGANRRAYDSFDTGTSLPGLDHK